MNNASSALATAGNTFEQSVALLTAANTTVQDISKASTGLRTITARLRNTTAELNELGEDMTESKYEELVSALTKAHVKLTDVNGDYRSTYDIMKDIADVWGTMKDQERAALTTAVAGTRMQNIFSSIVTQFQQASGAMDAMSNSAGQLSEAYATYLDSIEGRMAQLNATFQELSQKVLNTEAFKSLIAGLTKIVDILGGILSVGGGIVTKTLLIATAIKLLSLPKLIAWFKSLSAVQFVTIASTQGLSAAMVQLNSQGIAGLITSIPKLIYYFTSGQNAVLSFSAACEAMNLNPVIAGISIFLAAMYGVHKLMGVITGDFKGAIDDFKDSVDQYSESKTELDDVNAKLEDTQLKIDDLKKKGPLSILEQEELQRLIILNNELKITKQRISDLVNTRSITVQKDFVDLVRSFQNDAENARNFWEHVGGDILGAIGMGDVAKWLNIDPSRDFTSMQDRLDDLFEHYDWTTSLDNPFRTADGRIDTSTLDTTYGEIAEIVDQMRQWRDSIADINYSMLTDDAKEALDIIEGYIFKYTKLRGTSQDVVAEFLDSPKFQTNFKQMEDFLKTIDQTDPTNWEHAFSGMKNVVNRFFGNKYVDELADILGVDFSRAHAIFREYLADYYADWQEFDDITEDGLNASLAKLKEDVDGLTSAFSAVSSAFKELNEKGALSADTITKLLSLKPEYLNLLVDEEGQLNLTSESYGKLIKAKLEEMLVTQMQAAFDHVLGLDVEAAAAYAAAEAYTTETATIYDLIAAKAQLALADAAIKDQEYHTNAYTKGIYRTIDAYGPLINAIGNYSLAAENASSSTGNGTDALKEQKEALEDAKEAWNDYKDELTDAQSSLEDLIKLVTDYLKQQKEDEKTVLEERKKNFDDLIDKEKEELRVKKEAAEFDKKLKEQQNTVAKNALSASIASLDDSAAGRKRQKEANDELSKSRSDLQDTLVEHEYDIRIAALDALKEQTDQFYDGEIEKINDYLKDERRLYEDACKIIENDTGDLYGKLWAYTYKYTTETRAEFDHMWSAAQTALEKYGGAHAGIINIMEFLQREIYNTETQISRLDGAIDSISDKISALGSQGIGGLASQIDYLRAVLDRLGAPKWVFHWRDVYGNDQTKYSIIENQAGAIADILNQMGWDSRGGAFVQQYMQHLASGTTSARGGLTEVNEDGHEIRVLNKGDGILTAQITKNLSALGSDPSQFIADAGKQLLSQLSSIGTFQSLFGGKSPAIFGTSSSPDRPISITNHIQGDVNPSTLRALEAAQERITKKAVNDMMSQTLIRRRSSRV